MALVMACTSQTLLARGRPSRPGSRTHTIPDALATSIAATRSNTRWCSSSSITCGFGLLTAVTSVSSDMGEQGGLPGDPRSRPQRPEY